jgi:putative SOS response-associated peptidase YedK
MCGRYYIPEDDDDSGFKEIFEYISKKYDGSPTLSKMKRGEIFPTDIVPVLTGASPVLMKWGFSRFDGKGRVINARLETADGTPMFKKSFADMRCLIPAGHYFEWHKQDGGNKVKYAIGRNKPLYMAGLYRPEPDVPVPLFVILTRPAEPDISFIHDRMPVILAREQQDKWLSEGIGVQELLKTTTEQLTYRNAV